MSDRLDTETARLFLAAILSSLAELTDVQCAAVLSSIPETALPGLTDREALTSLLDHHTARLGLNKPLTGRLDQARINRACEQASDWAGSGVRTLLPGLNHRPRPQVLFVWGRTDLLNRPSAMVLNSRKPRCLNPDDRWFQVTIALARQVLAAGQVPVTSLGNYSYELIAYLAARSGAGAVIVCDDLLPLMQSGRNRERFFREYGDLLAVGRTLLVSEFWPGRLPGRKARLLRRDKLAATLAHRYLIAEVRAGGHMECLCSKALEQGLEVLAFQPPQTDRADKGNLRLIEAGALPWPESDQFHHQRPTAINDIPDQPRSFKKSWRPGRYLIHFTRACPGPWPGQGRGDYYRSLVNGDSDSGHTGFDTLKRILDEKKIRAGNRLVRGGRPVISFTAAEPGELKTLMTWRKPLLRWTVEPYGLAFDRKLMIRLGARPVLYGDDELWDRLPAGQKYRFQLHRPPETDWTREKEWRLAGDLDLRNLPRECIRVIVPTVGEANEVARLGGYRVLLQGDYAAKSPNRR